MGNGAMAKGPLNTGRRPSSTLPYSPLIAPFDENTAKGLLITSLWILKDLTRHNNFGCDGSCRCLAR